MTKTDNLKHFFLPMPLSAPVVKSILKYMFWFMAVVFAAHFMVQANTIMRSGSSTASIGFIFLPIEATISAARVWLFAFALGYFITALLLDSPKFNIFVFIFVFIILKGIFLFTSAALDVIKTKLTIYEINAIHGSNLIDNQLAQYTIYPKENQPFILEAIVLNPFTSSETLDQIAKINEPALEDKLESLYFFQPANSKGFSVKRLIARNPNTTAETLRELAQSSSQFVVEDIVANPNTPDDVLVSLWDKYGNKIAYSITLNPHVDAKILEEVAHQKEPIENSSMITTLTKANIAKNPNTPVEILEELSNEKEWAIIQNVIDNNRTPKAVVEKLSQSENPTITDYAKARLNQRK